MESNNQTVLNAMRATGRVPVRNAVIEVKPSPTADTRTADHAVSPDELRESTEIHIGDVKCGMDYLANLLRDAGERHDWTKLRFFPSFYRQFSDAQRTGCWGNGWYDDIHVKRERHHLEDGCPEDVNLLDVLEHIVDCVMAGKARKGKYTPDVLGAGILERAYANTQKMVADAVRVVK
jgi:hypothetical protein